MQAQDFHTPSYSETDVTGGGFGLSYAAMNATDVRTELGARFDDPTLLYGMPLILRGRLAWAHDFVSNPSLERGLRSAAGLELHRQRRADPAGLRADHGRRRNFSSPPTGQLIAKFDGEFAAGSQTYGGTGTLRYTW